jgi:hypothetical protein
MEASTATSEQQTDMRVNTGGAEMFDLDIIHLNIEVSASNATDEDVDCMTRQLLSELKELDVESAELARGETALRGSKGDLVTLGAIMISSLPAVLPAVVALVRAWSSRGQGRAVKFKGKGIEFEGPPEEFQKLFKKLYKGRMKE